jgi:hypothetical protein
MGEKPLLLPSFTSPTPPPDIYLFMCYCKDIKMSKTDKEEREKGRRMTERGEKISLIPHPMKMKEV